MLTIVLIVVFSSVLTPLTIVLAISFFYQRGFRKSSFEKGIRIYELNIQTRQLRRVNRLANAEAFFDEIHGFNWRSLYEVVNYFTLKKRNLLGFFLSINRAKLYRYHTEFEIEVPERGNELIRFIFDFHKIDDERYFMTIVWKTVVPKLPSKLYWKEIRMVRFEKLNLIKTNYVGYVAFNLRHGALYKNLIIEAFNSFYNHHLKASIINDVLILIFEGKNKASVLKKQRNFLNLYHRNINPIWSNELFLGSCAIVLDSPFLVEAFEKSFSLINYYLHLSISKNFQLVEFNKNKFDPQDFEIKLKILKIIREKIKIKTSLIIEAFKWWL